MREINHKGIFDKIGFYTVLVTISLLPIFFIPFSGINPESLKLYLLTFGVSIAVIMWVIARLVDGTITIPKNVILLVGLGLSVWFFIAALFSSSSYVSFVGQSFDIGTFASIIALTVMMFLSSYYFNSKERVSYLYFFMFLSFALVTLFEILFIAFGPKYLSLGTFANSSANMIGKWNDLGIYFGFMAMMSILSLELFSPQKTLKNIMGITLGFSVLGMMLVNFLSVWVALGIFSLIIFIFTLSVKRQDSDKKKFPVVSFVLVMLCLFFILGNSLIGGFMASKLGINQTEIRPGIVPTLSVLKDTIIHSPIIGSGPNLFSKSWSLYRPASINSSLFWDVSFNEGFGFIPTIFVTTGIIGGLLLLVLIAFLKLQGLAKVFITGGDKPAHYLFLSSFIGALYAWLFVFIYNPGVVLTTFAFVLTGIFIGQRISMGYGENIEYNFLKDPRQSFFTILLLVAVLIGTVSSLYVIGRKTVALGYFAKASRITDRTELKKAENYLLHATTLDHAPLYYRSLSQVYLSELSDLLNQKNLSEDTIKSEFQNIFGGAKSAAEAAFAQDKTSTENLIMLGSVYQAIVPLNVEGSYDNAKAAYTEAQKRSPNNPGLDLVLARLEIDHKDNKAARSYINSALNKKPNYTDAIFLLSQIEVSEGNVEEAIAQVEQVTLIEPNNSSVFFQLGLLRYNNKDYSGAVSAFERAVALNPDYLNARYFLGLSYEYIGKSDSEMEQFKYIQSKVPDNKDIQTIISNLQNGKPALSNTTDTTPENAKDLPVKEDTQGN